MLVVERIFVSASTGGWILVLSLLPKPIEGTTKLVLQMNSKKEIVKICENESIFDSSSEGWDEISVLTPADSVELLESFSKIKFSSGVIVKEIFASSAFKEGESSKKGSEKFVSFPRLL
jgi:hypothetical protein